jgi:glutaconate CoA-transferase subunit B
MSDANTNELMAYAVSRELADDDLVFVGVGTAGRAFTLAVGVPLVASRLAQLKHAPGLDVYWGNLLNPDLSAVPATLSQDSITRWRGAYAPADIGYKVDMLVRGEFDVSFESAAQIDRNGNLNITRIGQEAAPDVRLVGCLAQPEHLAFVARPIIVVDLSKRAFVESVDFVTSFGFGAGGSGRRLLGYTTPGPARVVTDRCVFDFTEEGAMRLRTLHRRQTLEDVLSRMSFTPEIASDLGETPSPSDEDLLCIRNIIDPSRLLLRA